MGEDVVLRNILTFTLCKVIFKVENLTVFSVLIVFRFLSPFPPSRRMYIRLRVGERRFLLQIRLPRLPYLGINEQKHFLVRCLHSASLLLCTDLSSNAENLAVFLDFY